MSSVIDDLVTQRDYVVERWLFNMVDRPDFRGEVTSEDIPYFPSEWTIDDIQRQMRRVNRVREMQAIMKGPEYAEALSKALGDATKAYEKKAPAIQKKIAELQESLGDLERAVGDAQAAVDERERARADIYQHRLPEWKKRRHAMRVRLLNKQRAVWLPKQSRLRHLDGVIELSERYFTHGSDKDRDRMLDYFAGAKRKDLDYASDQAVKLHIDELREEAAELRPIVEAGQRQHELACTELESQLVDEYLDAFPVDEPE